MDSKGTQSYIFMYPFSPKLHSYPGYHITLSRVPCAILLLLSCFSRVQLLATPWAAAHQAPPSMGFSRQEHWSGLPLPSPMHESEKWKWSRSVVSDSQRPHGLQPNRLLRPWDFPSKSTGVGCHCLLCNISISYINGQTYLNSQFIELKYIVLIVKMPPI